MKGKVRDCGQRSECQESTRVDGQLHYTFYRCTHKESHPSISIPECSRVKATVYIVSSTTLCLFPHV